jgi:hypothetical protein
MTQFHSSIQAQPDAGGESRARLASPDHQESGSLSLLRYAATAAVALLFLGMAASASDPLVMGVGLLPLAWIAVEAVWRLFDERGPRSAAR